MKKISSLNLALCILLFVTSSFAAPIITVLPASSISASNATLSITMTSTGTAPSFAYIFWGTADGGMVQSAWQNTNYLGEVLEGATATSNLYFLTANKQYYFNALATNTDAVGTNWGGVSSNFLTLRPAVNLSVSPSVIQETGGVAVLTATLGTVSFSNVIVNLDFTGTATYGVDYGVSATQMTVVAGTLTNAITITNITGATPEPLETIFAYLGPLAYGVNGSVTSATVTIHDSWMGDISNRVTKMENIRRSTFTWYSGYSDLEGVVQSFSVAGEIVKVICHPGSGGTVASNGYGVYFYDDRGVDCFGGTGFPLPASAISFIPVVTNKLSPSAFSPVVLFGNVTMVITNQGTQRVGTVDVFYKDVK